MLASFYRVLKYNHVCVITYLDFLILQFQLEQSFPSEVHKEFSLSALVGWPKSKLFQNPNPGTRLLYKCSGGGIKHLSSFLHVLRCLSNFKMLCKNESCPSLLYLEEGKGFLGRSIAWDVHSIGFTGRCWNHIDSYEHLSHYHQLLIRYFICAYTISWLIMFYKAS